VWSTSAPAAKVEVEGTILLDAAHKVGLYLSSVCGGDGYCGKCKVAVDEGRFQAKPTGLLTADEMRDNVVLACQTRVLSDLMVTVPTAHALETGRILIDSDAHRFSEMKGNGQGRLSFDPLCVVRRNDTAECAGPYGRPRAAVHGHSQADRRIDCNRVSNSSKVAWHSL
jgi:ferredoxin